MQKVHVEFVPELAGAIFAGHLYLTLTLTLTLTHGRYCKTPKVMLHYSNDVGMINHLT